MICPSCGTKNNYYHRFCYQCGYQLVEEPDKIEAEEEKDDNLRPLEEFEDTNVFEEIGVKEEDLPEETKEEESSDNVDSIFDYYDDLSDTDSQYKYYMEETIPLKRYQKGDKIVGRIFRKLLAACFYSLLAVALTFVVYLAYTKLLQGGSPTGTPADEITIDYIANYEQVVDEDNEPATKITINTRKGERVKVLGNVLTVENGKAEIIVKNSELYNMKGNEKTDDGVRVSLDITLSATGYLVREEVLEFSLSVPFAPLTLVSPNESEAVIEGNKFNLMVEVLPGSDITINDESYSHMVDEKGMLTVNLDVPDDLVNIYSIKVSAPGYVDNEEDIILKRQQFAFPLTIDQQAPIVAIEDWVLISGTTDPKAELKSSLETKEDPVVDEETGEFSINVKVTSKGLTALTLTATLEDQDDAVLDLVIEKPIGEGDYTRSAWAPNYNQLKNNPDVQNGQIFLIEGPIVDIISSGEKTSFIVNDSTEGEELYYVEYWGSFNFSKGDNIRLFGNRWNNKDDMPRILAKHIY